MLLDIEEAGERLGISRSQMFRVLGAGQLRSVKIGRLRRIPVAALREYVAQLEAQAADDASIPRRPERPTVAERNSGSRFAKRGTP
ncbi:helix-turn-helix domain-containing protein [Kineosporiaceae bacterium B12]|nr:helix-turn-helix domain-containing protein [Kineococcus rubinsiae]